MFFLITIIGINQVLPCQLFIIIIIIICIIIIITCIIMMMMMMMFFFFFKPWFHHGLNRHQTPAQACAEGHHDAALCAGLPGASAHVATGAR